MMVTTSISIIFWSEEKNIGRDLLMSYFCKERFPFRNTNVWNKVKNIKDEDKE